MDTMDQYKSKKAKIVLVGTIKDDRPIGWTFDCYDSVPALTVTDGEILYGGYSIAELAEISNRLFGNSTH